jgi:PPOX class probable F420-dependent enzyme
VPITFAALADAHRVTLYSALDDKPKSIADRRTLARVRDVLARPRVSVLVDRWSEDWSELAWLRLDGVATLVEPDGPGAAEHARAVSLLRTRYEQYAEHALERHAVIRVAVDRASGWSAT